jgi:cobyrinic acid a,c-diamide synthase
VVDFSPLHDECLPVDVDLVYFGCGNVSRFAHELSENHCMMSSLRNHVCGGKRVYGDGGGLAYLSQFFRTDDGQLVPMVGALPAVARATHDQAKVKPVEVTLSQDSWLGPSGTAMRGYLNTHWSIEPHGPLTGLLAEPEHEFDLVGRYMAVGSRLQLNFATRMDLLRGFVSNALSLPRV